MIPTFSQVPFYVGNQQYHNNNNIVDDAGKIFVGGIPPDASRDTITEYFSTYGAVSDVIIMVDNVTGRSRGFCFVTFQDQLAVNKVLAASQKHSINGKVVDAKRAVPKGPNQSQILRAMGVSSNRADRNPDCKIFVGGVAQGTTESDLENYFKDYGTVLEVKIPKDQNTQRARGFSFVLFETPECVIAATKERYHRINNKTVEVKTVQIQHQKGHSEGSDDGQLQSPPSPFMRSGGGFYNPQGYPRYVGASLESSGYGVSSRGQQGLDNYSYMAPMYAGMAELSISGRYPLRPPYHMAAASGSQVGGYAQSPSAVSPSSYSDYSSGGGSGAGGATPAAAYAPNYGAAIATHNSVPSGVTPFAPASTPQPGPGSQSFSR
ncbi:heterogeneous nuclear ribonucleoprotein D-like-B isoform X2 [Clytia hemisphaerica]|uniref:RRM domain-containing protein n=1 Tax=Clytia hemisphaerica TaxID=252671 RepID=A0A7M5X804_9CNID